MHGQKKASKRKHMVLMRQKRTASASSCVTKDAKQIDNEKEGTGVAGKSGMSDECLSRIEKKIKLAKSQDVNVEASISRGAEADWCLID